MENVSSFIRFAVVFILFLAALWASFELNQTISLTTDRSNEMTQEMDRDLAVSEHDPESRVSGSVVLGAILQINDIGATVTVHTESGSFTYSPGLDIEKTDVSAIVPDKSYVATYIRDPEGKLTRIDFYAQ